MHGNKLRVRVAGVHRNNMTGKTAQSHNGRLMLVSREPGPWRATNRAHLCSRQLQRTDPSCMHNTILGVGIQYWQCIACSTHTDVGLLDADSWCGNGPVALRLASEPPACPGAGHGTN